MFSSVATTRPARITAAAVLSSSMPATSPITMNGSSATAATAAAATTGPLVSAATFTSASWVSGPWRVGLPRPIAAVTRNA